MVSGVVSEVYKNGASLDLHGLSTDVYYQHLKNRVVVGVRCDDQMDGLAKLEAGQTFKGRIVSVCYSTRQVFVSNLLLTTNVAMEPTLPAIGQRLWRDAEAERVRSHEPHAGHARGVGGTVLLAGHEEREVPSDRV